MPFSPEHARLACNFFERVLRHTQDEEWANKPFMLAPWQEDAVTHIFGVLDDDGHRLITQVYLEVPKKSGKTEFVAGLILLCLLLDQNIGSQMYGAAAAQRQALNVFRAARTMVRLSRPLQKKFRVLPSTHTIQKRSDPLSFYQAIAADGDLSDGVNPAVTICDEVHRWRTRKQLENFDVLTLSGAITRAQSLSVAITTAGVRDESPLAWRLHEKTERLAAGIATDPTFYGRIYAADPKDDWADEKTWIKANPSLVENGGFVKIEKYRKMYQASLSDPEAQRSFRRYFLNLWDQKDQRAIDLLIWDSSPQPWKAQGLLPKKPDELVRQLPHDLLQHFVDQRCWAGVDMSMTTDMTAVAFIFPHDDGSYSVLPFFWMPENGIKNRELKDGMPYRQWEEQGFLELIPGNVIDHRLVMERLRWGKRMFDLREICCDPYETRQISVPMIEEGYICVDIGQNYSAMSEPCKKFLELVANRKLLHGGHPILRWNAHCLSTKEHNDRLMWAKPERHKDTARIDGITAATDALARGMLPTEGPSIYETRGIRSA